MNVDIYVPMIVTAVTSMVASALGSWLQFRYQQSVLQNERKQQREEEDKRIRNRFRGHKNGIAAATQEYTIHRHLAALRELMLNHEKLLIATDGRLQFFASHLADLQEYGRGSQNSLFKAKAELYLLDEQNTSDGEMTMKRDLEKL